MILTGTRRSQAATQAVVRVPRSADALSAPPGATGPGPTVISIVGDVEIPTVSAFGLACLVVLLAAGGFTVLRR